VLRVFADHATGARIKHLMHVLGDVLAIDSIGRASRNTAVPLLHPEDQVVQEMFDGWRNQQLSRNLSFQTIQQ
jgi:hypothetical protein